MMNNPVIFRRKEFLKVSENEFDQMIDVKIKETFLGTQPATERMIKREAGVIVNLSSAAGNKRQQRLCHVLYLQERCSASNLRGCRSP